jgi:hypothetical protein
MGNEVKTRGNWRILLSHEPFMQLTRGQPDPRTLIVGMRKTPAILIGPNYVPIFQIVFGLICDNLS